MNKKIPPTLFRNQLSHEISLKWDCPTQGNLSVSLKSNESMCIKPLRYSKTAQLELRLEDYHGEDWTCQGNLRSLIDPKVPVNLCVFTTTENKQMNDLFLYKTAGADKNETILLSTHQLTNATVDPCELKREIDCLKKTNFLQQPLSITPNTRHINATTKKTKAKVERLESIQEERSVDNERYSDDFGITNTSNSHAKSNIFSILSSDQVQATIEEQNEGRIAVNSYGNKPRISMGVRIIYQQNCNQTPMTGQKSNVGKTSVTVTRRNSSNPCMGISMVYNRSKNKAIDRQLKMNQELQRYEIRISTLVDQIIHKRLEEGDGLHERFLP